jgi:hypothetical protein
MRLSNPVSFPYDDHREETNLLAGMQRTRGGGASVLGTGTPGTPGTPATPGTPRTPIVQSSGAAGAAAQAAGSPLRPQQAAGAHKRRASADDTAVPAKKQRTGSADVGSPSAPQGSNASGAPTPRRSESAKKLVRL